MFEVRGALYAVTVAGTSGETGVPSGASNVSAPAAPPPYPYPLGPNNLA